MITLREFSTPYPNPYDMGSWGACAGVPPAPERVDLGREIQADVRRFANRFNYCSQTDKAWVVCLHNAGVIDSATAAKILTTFAELEASDAPKKGGGERDLVPALGGDEDLGSLINLGRTMQEPMGRLQMRDQMLDFFEHMFALIDTVTTVAEENVDTIMPGHTHQSQANPITLALYLLSVGDSLFRGLLQLELAYSLINVNSGGCGSTSGTTWPVDRWELTRLLGFDDLLEPTYDCEASRDQALALMFALTNIMTSLSKTSTDIQVWGLEEVDMIRMDPAWGGLSSMMPQKCHPGISENVRRIVCDVIGSTMAAISICEGEPHQDVDTMRTLPGRVIGATAHSKHCLRLFGYILRNVQPQKETMLNHVRQGYSCTTEVVVHMVRELGYGGRRAHRICATLVRLAREQGIPAPGLTGEMLDEAARTVEEEAPGIDTDTLQRLLDPVAFIENHSNVGGPAPVETRRMLKARRAKLAEARERQVARLNAVEEGRALLASEVARICDAVKE